MKTPHLDGLRLTPTQRTALLALADDGRAKVHGRTLQSLIDTGLIAWGSTTMGYCIVHGWGTGTVKELRRIEKSGK